MATPSDKVPESVQEENKSEVAHMESVARVMNFPIVKRAAAVVITVYTMIKDKNSLAQRTLTSAESIVKSAVVTASPLVVTFQKPIQKVDNLLCSGLDYVEKKIPSVTKDSLQMTSLLNYISETRPVKTLRSIPEYSKQKISASLNFKSIALSELAPYITTLKEYQQNLNIHELIANKVNKRLLSGLVKEVTSKVTKESREETTEDESPRKSTQEPQPEEKSQPKTEETMKKAPAEEAS